MSNELMSSVCEVDICGAIAMHALAQASQTPSALRDLTHPLIFRRMQKIAMKSIC